MFELDILYSIWLEFSSNFRDEKSEEKNSLEKPNADCHDIDTKSDGSDSTLARSFGSSSTRDFGLNSHPGEAGSRVW